ncbi:hypothetical protein [Streptomyces sp. NPDC002537]
MPKIRTDEGGVIRALRNGNAEEVGVWVQDALLAIVPERLPASAVRHPLDFVCLPLYRNGRSGLCLHIWPEAEEEMSPVVHAHSWDLWSYVVCGTVFNQLMSVHDEIDEPEHRVYGATSAGGVDEIRATGRLVTCAPEVLQQVHAGQIYQLPSGLFHRSGHQGVTATIVLGEHYEDRDNLVLGPVDAEPGADLPREACSPDEARELLKRIMGSVPPRTPAADCRPRPTTP